MSLLPKSHQDFSQKEYWDSFFKKRTTAFEWYGEYPELADHLHKYIKKQDNVLITGCGNSTLGRDLYDIGYENMTNIDISNVVIRQMQSQTEKPRPNLKYLQMDALKTSFGDAEFSVILDKGTLDALMPDETEETCSKIQEYFKEIDRILKLTGRYICISLLQAHILKILLNYFPANNWMFRAVRCFEAENQETALPVFMVICTKFKALPKMILELNLTSCDKMQRVEKADEIVSQIASVQQAAFVYSGLKRNCIADEDEVSFDLYESGCENPRFTIYVVDVKAEAKNAQYAAFLVPQGREAEWLFSTKAGRKNLVRLSKHNRLTIITLHRNQAYKSFEAVQNELQETIANLAPLSSNNKKVACLSLGADVGNRTVRHEGHSDYSGDYVVEDVETDGGLKYRRLFYLSSQLVIQSEAKLRAIKSRKGVAKIAPDLNYLTCKHHVYMSLAAACLEEKAKIAVIGLGGGGLCSFLHRFLPKCAIVGVDIDEEMLRIATDWFGFVQNGQLKAVVEDGLVWMKAAALNGEHFDAILFDVDSKDSSIGMSCPPKQFLEAAALDDVCSILGKTGLFVVNLVLRDESLRVKIVEDLHAKFDAVVSYKLDEDLNDIVICTNHTVDYINRRLSAACLNLNRFFKKNHLNSDDCVDVDDFFKILKIN